ncbi:hypothetical protein ACFLZV_04380 [Candidatus Margulisiibacteriota bacterium]
MPLEPIQKVTKQAPNAVPRVAKRVFTSPNIRKTQSKNTSQLKELEPNAPALSYSQPKSINSKEPDVPSMPLMNNYWLTDNTRNTNVFDENIFDMVYDTSEFIGVPENNLTDQLHSSQSNRNDVKSDFYVEDHGMISQPMGNNDKVPDAPDNYQDEPINPRMQQTGYEPKSPDAPDPDNQDAVLYNQKHYSQEYCNKVIADALKNNDWMPNNNQMPGSYEEIMALALKNNGLEGYATLSKQLTHDHQQTPKGYVTVREVHSETTSGLDAVLCSNLAMGAGVVISKIKEGISDLSSQINSFTARITKTVWGVAKKIVNFIGKFTNFRNKLQILNRKRSITTKKISCLLTNISESERSIFNLEPNSSDWDDKEMAKYIKETSCLGKIRDKQKRLFREQINNELREIANTQEELPVINNTPFDPIDRAELEGEEPEKRIQQYIEVVLMSIFKEVKEISGDLEEVLLKSCTLIVIMEEFTNQLVNMFCEYSVLARELVNLSSSKTSGQEEQNPEDFSIAFLKKYQAVQMALSFDQDLMERLEKDNALAQFPKEIIELKQIFKELDQKRQEIGETTLNC